DANEYALKVGPPAKSLGVAIRSAQWLGKGAAKPITTAPIAAQSVLVIETPATSPDTSSLAAEEAKDGLDDGITPPIAAQPVLGAVLPDAVPAQVIPDAPRAATAALVKPLGAEREYVLELGDRRYRVRGLEKNASFECLRVNVLASRASLVDAG